MKKYLLSALLMLSISAIFAQDKTSSDFGKNRFGIGLDYVSLGNSEGGSDTGFSSPIYYERIFGESGRIGLQAGLNIDILTAEKNEAIAIIALDVALKWYIMGQGKGFYFAPNIKIGSLGWAHDDDDGNGISESGSESYTSFGINAGYQFQISKLFGICPSVGYDVIKVGDSDFGDFGAFKLGVDFNFSF